MRKLADADLEAINRKIVEIHNRAAELGLLAYVMKNTSLKPEDMFAVKDWNSSETEMVANDDATLRRITPT